MVLDDYGQKLFHTLEQFETNRLFARVRNPELESIPAGPGIFNVFKRQVNAYGQLAAHKSASSKLVPKVVGPPKTDWRAHPQLPPSRQLVSSHERLRALKSSFFGGKKEHASCFASSKDPKFFNSASPSAPCFQEFFVAREPQVCSPLVPRKGNQEYVTSGTRPFLLDTSPDLSDLVEKDSTLRLQESAPMGRAWSKSGVQIGSSLCAEMQITACIQRF
jgi:hypothetical protein